MISASKRAAVRASALLLANAAGAAGFGSPASPPSAGRAAAASAVCRRRVAAWRSASSALAQAVVDHGATLRALGEADAVHMMAPLAAAATEASREAAADAVARSAHALREAAAAAAAAATGAGSADSDADACAGANADADADSGAGEQLGELRARLAAAAALATRVAAHLLPQSCAAAEARRLGAGPAHVQPEAAVFGTAADDGGGGTPGLTPEDESDGARLAALACALAMDVYADAAACDRLLAALDEQAAR